MIVANEKDSRNAMKIIISHRCRLSRHVEEKRATIVWNIKVCQKDSNISSNQRQFIGNVGLQFIECLSLSQLSLPFFLSLAFSSSPFLFEADALSRDPLLIIL